jgi:nucleoside-triphosphatase
MARRAPRILLEGRPGIGKTTVARRLAEMLRRRSIELRGFTTEELREGRARVGFAVETFDGVRAVLAHVDYAGPPRVSRYGVDLKAFENVALPALEGVAETELIVIDELGKMELASQAFCAAVEDVLAGPIPLVATIHVARHPFTDALKRRGDVEVVRVGERNRDSLPGELADRLAS